MSKLDEVEDVVIDPDGRMKYILIELTDSTGKSKTVVRGFRWADYHADILGSVCPGFTERSLDFECVGGGRINHSSDDKKIFVYGYSMGFGQADHSLTVAKLKAAFPSYESIEWSNEGY